MRLAATMVLLAVALLVPALSGQQAAPRFAFVDVVIDSGATPLAAWQVDLDTADVTIVGIEGGEHEAFAEPPYYDPKAMMGDRVVLGAFDLGDDLPVGKTRVARVHVRIDGPDPTYQLDVSAAATLDGSRIDVVASTIEGSAE